MVLGLHGQAPPCPVAVGKSGSMFKHACLQRQWQRCLVGVCTAPAAAEQAIGEGHHARCSAAERRGQSRTLVVQGKRGSRIRQGTPQEESALAAHITQLAPSQQRTSEAGDLAEVLVLLGHPAAAAQVQHSLSALLADQASAAAWVAQHPPPASSDSEKKKSPVKADGADWKWAILRDKAVGLDSAAVTGSDNMV